MLLCSPSSLLGVAPHRSLATFKRLHLAKGHRRGLIWKWKHAPVYCHNVHYPSVNILCACAGIYFKAAQGEPLPSWRCGTSSPHKRVDFLWSREHLLCGVALEETVRYIDIKKELCICVKSSTKGHSDIYQQGQLWEERADEKGAGENWGLRLMRFWTILESCAFSS